MINVSADIWSEGISVLFTSFWGWSPETWGAVGWTGDRGRGRRDKLLRQLSNPFITACYVTSHNTFADRDLKGKLAGFFLVSHETGDRDEFTHPIHHGLNPDQWRHSLRAIRAFSYLPEYRLTVPQFDPSFLDRARSVAAMGEVLTDAQHIARLRDTPWVEVDVYAPAARASDRREQSSSRGRVRAGPASEDGYVVAGGTRQLKRLLYVLRLDGRTEAYLGRPAEGRAIYKVGLSVSPDMRRQGFQNSMPRGAFCWCVDRTSVQTGDESGFSFDAAVAGEDAMKTHLVECAEWLGGEFYLATQSQIDETWRVGVAAMRTFGREN